jgi:hypothetical protein
MPEPQSWRALLGTIIKDRQERQRIAQALGINPITLLRWVQYDSNPRPHYLSRLPDLLPEYRAQLLALISEEYEEIPAPPTVATEASTEIPSAFYARIVRAAADLPPSLHFWSLCEIILRQALEQLDSQRLGMAIIIAQCMPPSPGHAIRSLREVVGRGTPPWSRELEHKATLLGAESLVGYAVSTGRLQYQQDLSQEGFLPFKQTAWEKSAAACPIMRNGRVAGALLVSSTQTNYVTPSRIALLQSYADLLMLVFGPEDFYDPSCIQLGVMPPDEQQRTYLVTLQQRVATFLLQAAGKQAPINRREAEQLAWQQLEEELLRLASQGIIKEAADLR